MPDTMFVIADNQWTEWGRVATGGGRPPQYRDTPSKIEPLAQIDPRWRAIKLGLSNYTIGAQGCALTCAAMVCRQLDTTLHPDVLQNLLKPAGGFWRANLNWAAIPRVVDGIVFDGITNWKDDPADIPAVIDHLLDHPLILWIDYRPGGDQQSHFVLGLEYLPEFNDILIADPVDGYTGRLLLRYGLPNWALERAIYGMRPLYTSEPAHAAAAVYSASCAGPQFDDYPDKYTGAGLTDA